MQFVFSKPNVTLWHFMSFVVGFCILFAGCAGEPKHPTWKNATGAEQNERLMWQSIQGKDWANVERHLSPTFVGVTADGRMFDRAGWQQQWQSTQVQEFSLGEVQVHPEGSDMKVTYVFHIQAPATVALPSSGFRVVSIWQDVKSRWLLSAISITPIQSQ
ncbi:MAG TPA: nuclear transport factor 2 family protein [Candidatus Acidoferrum sp.]|nr:nuclear transport factor 2 family protein [Candidatus Acidoferrum sp.]